MSATPPALGVHRWPDDADDVELARVRPVAEAAGWRWVDVHPEAGRAGLLRALGDALAFPAWYGENFDALADCLRDLSVATVLVWHDWQRLALEDHQAFHTTLEVLADRAADPVAPALTVLLPGIGPDLSDTPAVS